MPRLAQVRVQELRKLPLPQGWWFCERIQCAGKAPKSWVTSLFLAKVLWEMVQFQQCRETVLLERCSQKKRSPVLEVWELAPRSVSGSDFETPDASSE